MEVTERILERHRESSSILINLGSPRQIYSCSFDVVITIRSIATGCTGGTQRETDMQFKVGDRVKYIGGTYTDVGDGLGEVSELNTTAFPVLVQFYEHGKCLCRADELMLVESAIDVVSTPTSPHIPLSLDPDYDGPYTTYEIVDTSQIALQVFMGLEECLVEARRLALADPANAFDVVKVLNTHLYRFDGNTILAYPQIGEVQ